MGTSEMILNVPRYDFAWQTSYRLAKPLQLPKGTKIHCTAHFDNSSANPANPDPKKEVTWGDQTWEEMMIGWVDYIWEQPEKDARGRGLQGLLAFRNEQQNLRGPGTCGGLVVILGRFPERISAPRSVGLVCARLRSCRSFPSETDVPGHSVEVVVHGPAQRVCFDLSLKM